MGLAIFVLSDPMKGPSETPSVARRRGARTRRLLLVNEYRSDEGNAADGGFLDRPEA